MPYSGLKPLLFIFILLAPYWLAAQNYSLNHWTVEDGLSSNHIKDIFQDKEGFMWVATAHGLNQFDGYQFNNYRFQPGDSTSIGANFINNIIKDEAGNVWVNLAVGIISKFDKRTKKFSNYSFPDRNTYAHEIQFIQGFGILIATNQGLYAFDKEAQEPIRLYPQKEGVEISVLKIFPGSDQLYLSTSKGLILYKPDTGATLPVYFAGAKDTIPFEYKIGKCYTDRIGTVWIQTQSGSICSSRDGRYFKKSLAGSDKEFTHPNLQVFIHEFYNNDSLLCLNNGNFKLKGATADDWSDLPFPGNDIAFAFKDHNDALWAFTKSNQVFTFKTNQWFPVIELDDRLNYLEIVSVYVDHKNGVWLGSRGKGLWRITNRKWPINSWATNNPGLPDEFAITTMMAERDSSLLLGSFNNIYQYHTTDLSLIPYYPESENGNPFWGLKVNDIAKTTEGKIWVATSQGLVVIKGKRKDYESIKYVKVDGKNTELSYTRTLLPGPKGNIWLGTSHGLYLYGKETDQFYHFGSSAEEGSIRYNDIQCMMQVSDSTFLVGYIKEGVDLVTFNASDRSISCQKVRYIISGKDQFDMMTANIFYFDGDHYWVGTFSRGLLKLDLENLIMRPLSEEFPVIPNIKGIQSGEKGDLWISSIDGLRSVNRDDHSFYRFTRSAGLLSNQFYLNSSAKDIHGNLYFGSSKGINVIQPSKWNVLDTINTPILTGFKKYDENIIFPKVLDEVEAIELDHQDDFITFEFVSPTYDNPQDLQYAYQLQGFDADWRYSEHQRSATYTNLDPGSYVFKVKAGNKGGFLDSRVKQVSLFIAPPFWESAWFVIALIGMIILFFWLALKIQSRIKAHRLQIATEIRQKAADDFHDELGHRLTKIVLFVESLMLHKDKLPESSTHILHKIRSNANDLYHSTKDFIWAMNPSKDSALDLFVLLKDFGDELYADTDIQFSVEGIEEEHQDYTLKMDWKRQLVMIFKEAMNNALKHSGCQSVVLKIRECKQHLSIVLEDNGKGFTLDHAKFGYGLSSMVNRSRKIGGQLEINTQPGGGTEVSFKI